MAETDREIFTMYYRSHYPLILATCARRLDDRMAAEDAASEVFRVAWQRFSPDDPPTMPWLYRVARNVVANEYRRRQRTREREVDLLDADQAAPAQGASEVAEAMRKLPKRERELLFMAYWEDLSGSEIASILGISTASVWTRLNRARESFRRAVDRQGGGGVGSGAGHHG